MDDEWKRLEALRHAIDDIDDGIHDLLMRRVDVVQEIGRLKRDDRDAGPLVPSLAWRPDREARIMRRLFARHQGPLSFAVVARLWRELVAATTRLQGPLTLALPQTPDRSLQLRLYDLSRFHYGSETPIEMLGSPEAVIEAVETRAGVIGILPALPAADFDAWWPALGRVGETRAPERPFGRAKAIAALPCLASQGAWPEAYTIGCLTPHPTGEDEALVMLRPPAGAPSLHTAFAPETSAAGEGLTVEGQSTGPSGEIALRVSLNDADPAALLARFAGGPWGEPSLIGYYARPLIVEPRP
ncbi:MAG: chorismate mutase [Pseudomonadota bacterium]